MTCRKCGWYVRGGAHLCPNCGAEVPQVEEVRACPQCKAELRGRVSLCPACGQAVAGLTEGAVGVASPAGPGSLEPDASVATGKSTGAAGASETGHPTASEARDSKATDAARTCPSCRAELTRRMLICPGCGHSLEGSKPAGGVAGRARGWPAEWLAMESPSPSPAPRARKSYRRQKSKAPSEGAPEAQVGGTAAESELKPAEFGGPLDTKAPPVGALGQTKPWETSPSGAAGRPEMGPRPAPRPAVGRYQPAAKPAVSLQRKTGLIAWIGIMIGVVILSVVLYGLLAGGMAFGAAGPPEATPRPTTAPTAMATVPPTSTPEPTATPAPETPTPTPAPVTHSIQAGESLSAIAGQYGITVAALAEANGLDQSAILRIGQQLVIPPTPGATPAASAVTPTPSPQATVPSPTPAPTATPAPQATPTTTAFEFAATNLLTPADGAVFRGNEDILLNWSSVGLLGDDTWYVVRIWSDDPAPPARATGWTRTTAWRIPAANASSRRLYWSVTVMRAREGQAPIAVSPASAVRTFEWR